MKPIVVGATIKFENVCDSKGGPVNIGVEVYSDTAVPAAVVITDGEGGELIDGIHVDGLEKIAAALLEAAKLIRAGGYTREGTPLTPEPKT